MSLSIGIVGLPNVGKSTLFKALTKKSVLAANYPFATIEPNTGIVPVPDPRLEVLGEMFKSGKTIPATVTFVDIAGLVAGAHKGEGMGNAFLSHVRETDAIVQVVRAFDDPDVQHVANRISPQDDIDIINTELILADIQTIDKHLPKAEKEAKANPKARAELELLKNLREELERGQLLSSSPRITNFPDKDSNILKNVRMLNLLTLKPFIYVFNLDEGHITDSAKQQELKKLVPDQNAVFVSAKIESELAELEGVDADDLMASYGIAESGLERLAKAAYDTLELQSYLTAGEKEVKAWTVRKGATAPQAAGVIHGDFEKGFIAAEVVSYPDLVEAGSKTAAKSAGKVRLEGKDYVMRPDDVVEFRFNK